MLLAARQSARARWLHGTLLIGGGPFVKLDVMRAFNAFWHLDTRKFHTIKEAIMVLLPKTLDAATIRDYWSILFIHVLEKLFSKVLTNCLVPRLSKLIHISQSAFIKGRYI
jgi:hypothetical protein